MDIYKILGVKKNASLDELREAFAKMEERYSNDDDIQ